VESVITTWLTRYESGALTRRQLIQGLAMLATAAAPAPVAAAPFEMTALDHVQINARHAKESADWYVRVLGLKPVGAAAEANEEIARVGTADGLLVSLRKLSPPGKVDHIAFRTNVGRNDIARELQARGVAYALQEKNGPPGDYIVDPDGIRIQIMPTAIKP